MGAEESGRLSDATPRSSTVSVYGATPTPAVPEHHTHGRSAHRRTQSHGRACAGNPTTEKAAGVAGWSVCQCVRVCACACACACACVCVCVCVCVGLRRHLRFQGLRDPTRSGRRRHRRTGSTRRTPPAREPYRIEPHAVAARRNTAQRVANVLPPHVATRCATREVQHAALAIRSRSVGMHAAVLGTRCAQPSI